MRYLLMSGLCAGLIGASVPVSASEVEWPSVEGFITAIEYSKAQFVLDPLQPRIGFDTDAIHFPYPIQQNLSTDVRGYYKASDAIHAIAAVADSAEYRNDAPIIAAFAAARASVPGLPALVRQP